ncbi:diaminopimelate decarboxylase [archaeon]|nr:diaminopimelate decarboxylase [archaeon]
MSDSPQHSNGRLTIDGVDSLELTEKFGTPLYVLSERTIEDNYIRFKQAVEEINGTVAYSCKTNSTVDLLKTLRAQGAKLNACTVEEIVLGMVAGFRPADIYWSNYVKRPHELEFAMRNGVGLITLDSQVELESAKQIALKRGCKQNVLLRINPQLEVEAGVSKHEPYNKYGVSKEEAIGLMRKWNTTNLGLRGFHFHLGSQLHSTEPYLQSLKVGLELLAEARKIGLKPDTIDLGGGYPVQYTPGEKAFAIEELAAELGKALEGSELKPSLIFEPGRAIVAEAWITLSRIGNLKKVGERNLAVLDIGYNALLDTCLIDWVFPIVCASKLDGHTDTACESYDLGGVLCDNMDFVARDVRLPPLEIGDVIAVMKSGAYTSTLASNFNMIPRPPVVTVQKNGRVKLSRQRETISDMLAAELDRKNAKLAKDILQGEVAFIPTP